ncbi:MAG TPA: oxidoreductase [Xylella sp.]
MNSNGINVALITGTSSGIGEVTALALKRAGFRVFGTSRKEICTTHSDSITMLKCDVTDDTSVQQTVEEVVKQTGRIDLLVNNAGTGLLGATEESSATQAQALFNVNVFGMHRFTNAVLPIMRRQKKGRIINISSILGLIPAPYNALYSSTKHAMEGYSESLDHELRTFGIRVVLVEPSATRTSFEDNITRPDKPLPCYEVERSRMEAVMRKMVHMGDSPAVVATTVVEAALATKPKRRYAAGQQASQVRALRRFFPDSLFDRSLRKINGLPACP